MASISEILARAAALRDETALNSIDPERAGSIMYDTLIQLNELWLSEGSALVISKLYSSVSAMNADTSPVSDLTGRDLIPGQIVAIASSNSDNGKVYRYNGSDSPRWTQTGTIGNIPVVNSLTSDSTTTALSAAMGKALKALLDEGYLFMGIGATTTSPGTPSGKVFYIVPAGTYTNFGSTSRTVDDGYLGIFKYTGSAWAFETVKVSVQLANNLNTEDTTKALAAPQGKVLDEKISQLGQEVTNVNLDASYLEGRIIGQKNVSSGYYNSSGVIVNSEDYVVQETYVPISNGDKVKFLTGTGIPNGDFTHRGALYDAQKNHISAVAPWNGRELEIQVENASYIRVTFTNDLTQTMGLIVNGKVVFTPNFQDGELEDVYAKIDETKEEIENEFAYSNCVIGYYLKKYANNALAVQEGGKLLPNALFGVSELIPFETSGKTVTVYVGPHADNNFCYVYLYDDYKRLMMTYNAVNAQYRTIDFETYDAKYIRISFALNYSLAGVVYDGNYIWKPKLASEYYNGLFDTIKEQDADIDALRNVINLAKSPLITACRYGYGTSMTDENNNVKDGQALVMTDTHTYKEQIGDTIAFCNDIDSIDIMLLCGDYCLAKYNPEQAEEFIQQLLAVNKPLVLSLGNHDVGQYYYCGDSASHKQLYDSFIAPLVAAGKITNYTPDVPYYLYDETNHKIRFISVYEYDSDLSVDETHWELVAYDDSAPMISRTATYNTGDVVNVPYYTTGSFKAKETIDMTGASTANKDKYPSYKMKRDFRCIREAQANWLANALLTTPAGYRVVILSHQHFSGNCSTQTDKKFCINQDFTSGLVNQVMVTDLIAEMVDAFMNKQSFSKKVVMGGDAAYMNVLEDGGVNYAYQVDVDFSSLGDVGFLCYVNGHDHRDMIWKHNVYPHQWGIGCSQTGYYYNYLADIRRSRTDVSSRNSITCISFDKANLKVRLVKIGNRNTIDGRLRDFEVLDL